MKIGNRLKGLFKLLFILFSSTTIFFSCNKEVIIPVEINYSVAYYDNSQIIPTAIIITNQTKYANSFKWTFEGGNPATSDDFDPGLVYYNKSGTFKITLVASNGDDSKTKTFEIRIDSLTKIGFDIEIIGDSYAPAKVLVHNKTLGAQSFKWTFIDAANLQSSTLKEPDTILYNISGTHEIILEANNNGTIHKLIKQIEILPELNADFDVSPSFEDDDYQIPFSASFANKSNSASSYKWIISGGGLNNDTLTSPEFFSNVTGIYSITLIAKNSKGSKQLTKQFTLKPNTNLRTISNIQLGINTAHGTIGSMYSTRQRKVYTENDNIDTAGMFVDLVYFGLNQNFNFNKFLSPDSVQNYTFNSLPNAQLTEFINNISLCNCGVNFTETDFDNLSTGNDLKTINFNQTEDGLKPFNNASLPQLILFKTQDERLGAIKVKQFVQNGNQSYILMDIKIMKEKQ